MLSNANQAWHSKTHLKADLRGLTNMPTAELTFLPTWGQHSNLHLKSVVSQINQVRKTFLKIVEFGDWHCGIVCKAASCYASILCGWRFMSSISDPAPCLQPRKAVEVGPGTHVANLIRSWLWSALSFTVEAIKTEPADGRTLSFVSPSLSVTLPDK